MEGTNFAKVMGIHILVYFSTVQKFKLLETDNLAVSTNEDRNLKTEVNAMETKPILMML